MFREATLSDVELLSGIFWDHISRDRSYISHGEMQMGLLAPDGELAADSATKWEKYIGERIGSASGRVFIMELQGRAAGFTVLETTLDGGGLYGVICDIVIRPEFRGCGAGTGLLQKGMSWLEERGARDIYLESGVGNHAAHSFFQHRGFGMVSHVFKYSGL